MSRTYPPLNVLVLMTDQQSAESLGHLVPGGHLHTPAMSRLAREGLSYQRAYCADPICMPSRTSMFTGRWPHETGVMNNNWPEHPVAFPTMGTLFRRQGYDTGYVGKWHIPCPLDEEHSGFRYRACNRGNGIDPSINEEALRFLREERGGDPFLLVLSYNNPHNICEWARGARGQLPDVALPAPPPPEACPPLRANHSPQQHEPDAIALLRRSYHATRMSPVGDFGETEWRQYLWAYYRMIESVDRYMEAFLDHPEVRALLDHTLIVFLSDHGDCQGAQLWNQKTVLLDESSRVPLLFHQPGRIEPGVSRTLAQTGIDLFPTLCNLAGLEIPADLPGSPLLDTEGRPCDPGRPCVVSVCSMVQGAEIDGVKPELEGRMVRSDRYKYCQYDRGSLRESLVDMEDDPGETRNLAPDPAFRKVVHEHRNLLADHCRVTGDPFLALFNREAERQG